MKRRSEERRFGIGGGDAVDGEEEGLRGNGFGGRRDWALGLLGLSEERKGLLGLSRE